MDPSMSNPEREVTSGAAQSAGPTPTRPCAGDLNAPLPSPADIRQIIRTSHDKIMAGLLLDAVTERLRPAVQHHLARIVRAVRRQDQRQALADGTRPAEDPLLSVGGVLLHILSQSPNGHAFLQGLDLLAKATMTGATNTESLLQSISNLPDGERATFSFCRYVEVPEISFARSSVGPLETLMSDCELPPELKFPEGSHRATGSILTNPERVWREGLAPSDYVTAELGEPRLPTGYLACRIAGQPVVLRRGLSPSSEHASSREKGVICTFGNIAILDRHRCGELFAPEPTRTFAWNRMARTEAPLHTPAPGEMLTELCGRNLVWNYGWRERPLGERMLLFRFVKQLQTELSRQVSFVEEKQKVRILGAFVGGNAFSPDLVELLPARRYTDSDSCPSALGLDVVFVVEGARPLGSFYLDTPSRYCSGFWKQEYLVGQATIEAALAGEVFEGRPEVTAQAIGLYAGGVRVLGADPFGNLSIPAENLAWYAGFLRDQARRNGRWSAEYHHTEALRVLAGWASAEAKTPCAKHPPSLRDRAAFRLVRTRLLEPVYNAPTS